MFLAGTLNSLDGERREGGIQFDAQPISSVSFGDEPHRARPEEAVENETRSGSRSTRTRRLYLPSNRQVPER